MNKIRIKKIREIEKLKYLNAFIIDYIDRDNIERTWELVSRDGLERLENEINKNKSYSDGVMIFACNKEKTELIILKEFRVVAGKYIYTLPAGLIDSGEDVKKSAKREFKEETGLDIDVEYVEKERYTSVGIINEKVSVAYGYYSGTPSKEYQEATEDAEIEIIDKIKAKEIIENEEVSMRTALLIENFFKLNSFLL